MLFDICQKMDISKKTMNRRYKHTVDNSYTVPEMAWWKIYPKTKRGNDLIGKKLVLDPERPPEDTSFSGMKNVFVKEVGPKDAKIWQQYKVMMTEQDIATAVQCIEQMKWFTFEKAKGAKFATVEVGK